MRLATTSQVRELEARYRHVLGLPLMALMESAGAAVSRAVLELNPARALALCGKGNNGGDALVAARRLLDAGTPCEAWLVGRRRELKGDAAAAATAFASSGGRIREAWASHAVPDEVSVVIDGVLGAGLTRAPEGPVRRAIGVIRRARSRGVRVVAIDVPSGLSSDTGTAPGNHVDADITVSFAPLKLGLAQDAALDVVGRLVIADIGIPLSFLDSLGAPNLESIELNRLAASMGPRPTAGFKTTFGHVLCIGGSPGKPGAIALTAMAALRTGAGLVTVCARTRELSAVQRFRPEIMGWPLDGSGPLGLADAPLLRKAIEGKQAVVCGPGLYWGSETGALIRSLMESSRAPWIIDADALNALSPLKASLPSHSIVTPHPGEAARLIGGTTPGAIQADRLAAVSTLVARSGAVVVLKGARTLVASGSRIGVSLEGSPLLATAGSGDVLSGILGAVAARHRLALDDAAQFGVALHARLPAGLLGRRTAIASDLIDAIPGALPC